MNRVGTLLRNLDLYGVQVASLNINGETKFNTPFGGIVSIFYIVFLAWFTIINFTKLFGFEDASLSEVT